MKKLLLRKYDDGKIRFYKTFNNVDDLLVFANDIKNDQSPVTGPVETDDKILYSLNLVWNFDTEQKFFDTASKSDAE